MVRKLPIDNFQYWESDVLRSDLKQRSLHSGLITFGAQPVKVLIGVSTTAILARLLTPADFGLVAMLLPLLAIVDSVSNLGLETATVQREGMDHQQASAVFWISLKINVLIIAAMVLVAPLLARFYEEQSLTAMAIVMAIGVASVCLSFQHKSLLKRQMQFGVLTSIEVVSLVVGAGAAIAVAWMGWGYWALVLQLVVPQIVQGVAYWLFCGWRPTKYVKPSQADTNVRAMLSYGLNLSGFRLITRIGMKLDQVLIGYLSGASALGLYSMAYQWAYFPFNQIYPALFDVAVSSLSRAASDPQQYRNYCRQSLTLMFGFCMPAMALLFVSARDFMLLLLGSQWLVAVPIFQVLSVAVFIGSLYRVTKWIYVSVGHTQRQLQWGLIHTPVMITAVAIGSHWGALGVAIGYATGISLLTYPSVAFCLQLSPLTMGDFMSTFLRPATASIASGFLLFLSRLMLTAPGVLILSLILNLVIFGVLYIGIYVLLPGGLNEIKSLYLELKNLLAARKKKQ
ncbi:lipopolysaccharide biosynthesis protein [Pseudanabaena sp. FACHB-2040]|uniref:lipopolysaccharide biosynthesis protein n=1 Tax=Pseudanabaena sp. FACHB-2040 TaxID=2692859 RepID=UPI0016890A83|nr:lipopolysaccharide biosynthesis protein [Pseudanabaena sp. FACHB-2040]MBD2256134.1 lipopolysaccharide biosynthesis protein [Pseudanabaena sp. FACHB-2040]